MIHSDEKNQTIEIDPDLTQILALSDDGLKTITRPYSILLKI